MNEVINKEIDIENMIYEVRGVEVMFAADVARIYNVETKRINETIKRNIKRFPEMFCFQISNEEYKKIYLRSHLATLNKSNNLRGSHIKYLPYVLTEQGIMMLSGLLKSDIAILVNIKIIDAFVKMRKYISSNLIEQNYINNLVLEDHENIKLLQSSFSKLEEKDKINSIFFEGQIYDSYSLLIDILSKANKEIIIIDNYAGKELLDILKDINKNIVIVSKNIKEELINKYKSQYNNISFIYNNSFHDRFIIIDKTILYHSGSSFKDLGKKCFAINLIDDKSILNEIITKIEEYYDK